eukprot:GHVT01091067.1.p1 GENE.GHVT01091067.1~~GHVT01091067.1.p1  ORF type:complete len:174 (-),score=20.52 GHVT01091067.1:205-726(-)
MDPYAYHSGVPAAGGAAAYVMGVDLPQGGPSPPADLPTAAREHLGEFTNRLSSQLLEGGNRLLHQAQKIGEGPLPVRALCFMGGLALVVTSLLTIINVFSVVTKPASYILQVYMCIFGLMTMVVEAKDFYFLDRLKPFWYEWCKFLTVPGGKGAFYLFIGQLHPHLEHALSRQ